MALEMKVVNRDPISGSIAVKFRNSHSKRVIDDYEAYAFTPQAATEEEALAEIAASGRGIANRQDALDLVREDPSHASFFVSLVGRTITTMSIGEESVQSAEDTARRTLEVAVQKHLDDTAAARGYGDDRTPPMVSACSYAGAPNAFQAESQAFLQWRAACWQHCYQVMAAVMGGERAIPTAAQLIAELPSLVLPS